MHRTLRIGASMLIVVGGVFAIRWAVSNLLVPEAFTWVDIIRLYSIGWPLVATACFLTLTMELYCTIGSERRR